MTNDNKLDKIIELLQKTYDINVRQEAEFYYKLGINPQNNYKQAKAYLDKCIALGHSEFKKASLGSLFTISLKDKKYDEAEKYAKELIEIDSDEITSFQNYAEVLLLKAQYGSAKIQIEKAMKLESNLVDKCINRYLLALCVSFDPGDKEKEIMQQIVELTKSVGVPTRIEWDFTDDTYIIEKMQPDKRTIFNNLIKVLKHKLNPLDFEVLSRMEPFEIIKASYGLKGRLLDVTTKLRESIKDNKLVYKGRYNDIFPDPVVSVTKKLFIVYAVKGDRQTKEYTENEPINLP